MQLFAVVASVRGADDMSERRLVVYNFLSNQLNKELANKYIARFDEYYRANIEQSRRSDNQYKVISRVSMRVMRITMEINRELTQYQKYVILVNLYEYLNTGHISYVEQGLVHDVVADKFNISNEEFELIHNFILDTENVPNRIIFTSDEQSAEITEPKHIVWEDLAGEVHFVYLSKINVFLLKYFGQEGQVEMNGLPIKPEHTYIMRTGYSIRNGISAPIFFNDIMRYTLTQSSHTPITIEARNVEYRFNPSTIGLHKFSFEAHSGSLVGIMGVSGSGKSTFSNVISGMAKPYSGHIYINNIDIYEYPEDIKGLVGYVTQDDILFEDLTVYENLYYAARLTFDNLSLDSIKERVNNILQTLGLHEVKDIKAGGPANKKISGGQHKRLNIALELIREPPILILDEPTSGLSSHDAESIIELLKDLAIRGKLIFAVIHQPSSDIFKMFDQLLVLDTGGYLIYDGNPIESLNYFKSALQMLTSREPGCKTCGNINVEQVLNMISMPVVDEYGNNTQLRKVSPEEWYERLTWGALDISYVGDPEPLPQITFKTPSRFKQIRLYLMRDVKSKMANMQYMLINLLEAPLLAALLAMLLRYYNVSLDGATYTYSGNPNIPVYLIISVICAFFIGLTVSAEEIIQDRLVIRRERFLNLSRSSYIMSKCLLTSMLSAFQMFIFVLVGNAILGIHSMLLEYWLVLFSTAVAANLVGLNLSDSLKKTINIYIIIPFMVIPQLILSGVFVSFDKMNPEFSHPSRVPVYGHFVTAHWAFEALAVNQFIYNDYEENFYIYHKAKSQALYYKDYWVPMMRNYLNRVDRFADTNRGNWAEGSKTLKLVRDEIYDPSHKFGDIALPSETLFNINLFSKPVYDTLLAYLEKVRRYNVDMYNKADRREEEMRRNFTPQELEELRKNFNKSVEDVVCCKSNTMIADVIKEFDGRLWQKSDVIYQDTYDAFNAPLYSPYKCVAGVRIDTYIFDIIVIWLENLALLLLLLCSALNKFFMGVDFVVRRITERKKKKD